MQVPVLRFRCDGQLPVRAFLPPLLAVLRSVPYRHHRRSLDHVGGSPGSQGEPLCFVYGGGGGGIGALVVVGAFFLPAERW